MVSLVSQGNLACSLNLVLNKNFQCSLRPYGRKTRSHTRAHTHKHMHALVFYVYWSDNGDIMSKNAAQSYWVPCALFAAWAWSFIEVDQQHFLFLGGGLPTVILTPVRLFAVIWLQAMRGSACLSACLFCPSWTGWGVEKKISLHVCFHRANTHTPIYQINKIKSHW